MPPKRAAEKPAEKSATINAAAAAIDDIFSSPPPPPAKKIRANRGGDSNFTSLCKIQGVVLRASDVTREYSKGPTKKRVLEVVITGMITNGAQDCVRSGVPGENFLLPTRVVEGSAPSAEGDDKKKDFKGKSRELVVEDIQRCRKLSCAKFEFFKEPGEKAKKTDESPGVNSCVPGSLVEISGVVVNLANGKGGEALYLNASSAVPLASSDAVSDAVLARHLIQLNSQPEMMSWAVFGASRLADGWFNVAGLNASQQRQAEAGQTTWKTLNEGVADRFAVMAAGKDEDTAAKLNSHESRIRAIDPARLADGATMMLLPDQSYDKTIAPIVQSGIEPWNRKPTLVRKLQAGGEEAEKLPDKFAAFYTTSVEVHKDLLSVEMGAVCVTDKEAALEAIDAGLESPMLVVQHAAAFSLSMKDFGAKLGCMFTDKASMGVKELLPFAEEAAYPTMNNMDGASMTSEFPFGGTLFTDMPRTLQKAGILVSEDWVKKSLCGGGVQFIAPKTEREKYNLPDKHTGEMPFLSKNYYQELTSDSFDLDDFKSLPKKTDRKLEYRVVYEGVTADLAQAKELASEEKKGEDHIEMAISACEDDDLDTPKKWLCAKALLYASLL